MAKTRRFEVYFSGGGMYCWIYASCITKAVRHLVEGFDYPATFKVLSRSMATVTYEDNISLGSDFVVMEVER